MISDKYMVEMLTDIVDKNYNGEKISRLTYDESWCLKEFLQRIEQNLNKLEISEEFMGMTGDKCKDEYGLEWPMNIDFYRDQTKKAIEKLKFENTKKILPDIFKMISEAAQRGEWSCRVTQDSNIFKLIDKSDVSRILKEQGFDTKYVTICRDESVYQITWGA